MADFFQYTTKREYEKEVLLRASFGRPANMLFAGIPGGGKSPFEPPLQRLFF